MKVKLFLLILCLGLSGCTMPLGGSSGTKISFAPEIHGLQWWDKENLRAEIDNQSLMDNFGMRVSFHLISEDRSQYEKNEQRLKWLGDAFGIEIESAPIDWMNAPPP